MVKETYYIIKSGCGATFKKRQESDWLDRPGSVSCSHLEQLITATSLTFLPAPPTKPPSKLAPGPFKVHSREQSQGLGSREAYART